MHYYSTKQIKNTNQCYKCNVSGTNGQIIRARLRIFSLPFSDAISPYGLTVPNGPNGIDSQET